MIYVISPTKFLIINIDPADTTPDVGFSPVFLNIPSHGISMRYETLLSLPGNPEHRP